MKQRFAIRSLLIGTLGLWLATASCQQGIACRNRMKSLNETYYKDGWSFRTLTSVSSGILPSSV